MCTGVFGVPRAIGLGFCAPHTCRASWRALHVHTSKISVQHRLHIIVHAHSMHNIYAYFTVSGSSGGTWLAARWRGTTRVPVLQRMHAFKSACNHKKIVCWTGQALSVLASFLSCPAVFVNRLLSMLCLCLAGSWWHYTLVSCYDVSCMGRPAVTPNTASRILQTIANMMV